MSTHIWPDLERFVQQELSSGRFPDREALIAHALRLLQRDREDAIAGIRAGLDDVAAGRGEPLPIATERQQKTKQTFEALSKEWKAQTRFMSSFTDMAMLPTYQRIIGLGPVAVPWLLQELENDPDYWFSALEAITGENPVPEELRGNLEGMAAAWLEWGRVHGYVAGQCDTIRSRISWIGPVLPQSSPTAAGPSP
ncbi:MAG: type II toxin-antitoxin system ParD family antitoxin [Pirellulales bacterium]